MATDSRNGRWVFRNQQWHFVPESAAVFDVDVRSDTGALTSLVDTADLRGSLLSGIHIFRLPIMIAILQRQPEHNVEEAGQSPLFVDNPEILKPAWWKEMEKLGGDLPRRLEKELGRAAMRAAILGEATTSDSFLGPGTIQSEPIGFTSRNKQVLYGIVTAVLIGREHLPDLPTLTPELNVTTATAERMLELMHRYILPDVICTEYGKLLKTHVTTYSSRVRQAWEHRLELAEEQARSHHLLIRAENLERQLLRGSEEIDKAQMSSGIVERELTSLLENPDIGITIEDTNYKIRYQNPLMRRRFGNLIGHSCHQVYKDREEPCEPCPITQIWEQGHESVRYSMTDPRTERSFEVIATPMVGERGEKLVVEVGMEMTHAVKRERALEDRLEAALERQIHLSEMCEQMTAFMLDLANLDDTLSVIPRLASVALTMATRKPPENVDMQALVDRLLAPGGPFTDRSELHIQVMIMPTIPADPASLSNLLKVLVQNLLTLTPSGVANLTLSHTMSGTAQRLTHGDRYHIFGLGPGRTGAEFSDNPGQPQAVSGVTENIDGSIMDTNLLTASLLIRRLGGELWRQTSGESGIVFGFSIPTIPPTIPTASG